MVCSTPSPETPIWDPKSVLELINTYNHSITCTAYAATRYRRCRRSTGVWISSYKIGDLANMDPSTAAKSDLLHALAYDTICWQHRSQQNSVVAEWQRKIERYIQDSGNGSERGKPKKESEEQQYGPEAFARFKEQFDEFMAQYAKFQEYQQKYAGSSTGEGKSQSKDSKPNTGDGSGSNRGGRTESNSGSAHAKQEQPRQANDSHDSQPKTPKTENSSRPKPAAPPGPKPWSEVWSKYKQDWEVIQADPTDRDVKVPWPVRSGKFSDVTQNSVREFFTNALKSECSNLSAAATYSMMNRECMKWHPDKLFSRFDCLVKDEVQETTNMIIILVRGLRDEAKENRNRQRAASL